MDNLKAKNRNYVLYPVILVLIYSWYISGSFDYIFPVVRDFLNNVFDTVNLTFRVDIHDVDSVFEFIICFCAGILPIISCKTGEFDMLKKWEFIGFLCLGGLVFSTLAVRSTTFITNFIVNLIGYTFGVLVYLFIKNHFKKKDKNIDSKKV